MFVMGLSFAAMLLSAAIGHADLEVTVVRAQTGDTGNGRIDHVLVTFSAVMDPNSTPQAAAAAGQPGWRVEGHQITGFAFTGSNTQLKISIDEAAAPDTGDTPTVSYVDGDGLLSALGRRPQPYEGDATDAVGPVIVDFRVNDVGPQAGLFKDQETANQKGDEAWITFSEPASLLGATPHLRWANLDKAVKFTNEGTGCPGTEGTGSPSAWTFPQPNGAAGSDAIIVPAGAQERVSTFHVKFRTGTVAGTHKFVGVPVGCWVGIDAASGNNAGIVDAVNNPAQPQPATPVLKVYPRPVDASLLSARTVDGNGSAPDGVIDAIRLAFDQRVDDASVLEELSRIQISHSGVIADVDTTAVDTDTDQPAPIVEENDYFIDIPFTLPGGASWGTGVTPAVSYAKPSQCSQSVPTSRGMKAFVPTPGYRACIASFSQVATDAAGPRLLSALTMDVDGDGKIDKVQGTFSEPIAAGTAAGWTMNGQTATAFAIGTDPRNVEISFNEGPNGDTGSTPSVAYATQATGVATKDAAGIQAATAEKVAADGAAPRIARATVRDTDGDGALDRAILTYSEPVLDPANASGFAVGGVPATGFAPGDGDAANDATLTLAVEVPGTAAQEVAFAGSIRDALNNVSGDQTLPAGSVTDEAPPVGDITISPTAPLGPGESTISIEFSETMSTATAPTVTLGGTTVTALATSHTNGFRNDNSRVWEGTVTIAEGDCAIPTGCDVQAVANGAKDAASPQNTQRQATRATQIDTIAPQPPVLGAFDSTLEEGETAPVETINMFTRSIGIGATVLAGDAQGGTAQILAGGSVIPGALDETIGASDTSVSPTIAFADVAAINGTLPDGTHPLSVRVCDDANNCSDTPTAVDVVVDTAPVDVALTQPAGGDVVAGGETVTIGWDADEAGDGFDHVEVAWSDDGGETYEHVLVADAAADGTFDWTVPTIDVAFASVRAAAVDTNGNKGYGTVAEAFSIDSTAPIVTVTSPSSSKAFLPAGETATVRWNVADATIHRVEAPIDIEFSNDGGATWAPINAGDYSHADDGEESWNVPGGMGFDMRLRVTAVDATGAIGREESVRLGRGIEGFVAGSNGEVVHFGSGAGAIDEARKASGDWVRGLAVRSTGTSGYVLGSDGKLYPFAVGSASMPTQPKTTALKGDQARGVALRTNTSGYVVSRTGRLHPFGGAPKPTTSKTFACDCARGITLLENGRGGYVLDAYGRLHPFRVGSYAMPRQIQKAALFGSAKAVGFALRANERSGYVLSASGALVPFGGAPRLATQATGGARALVMLTDSTGYWIDRDGRMHRIGRAFGDPSTTKIAARAAAAR